MCRSPSVHAASKAGQRHAVHSPLTYDGQAYTQSSRAIMLLWLGYLRERERESVKESLVCKAS